MKLYNWQQSDWPNFRFDLQGLYVPLLAINVRMGFIGGQFSHLQENVKGETIIHFMVMEAIKTSAIEGEKINLEDVKSSIKNKLGLNAKPALILDKRAPGIAKLMLEVNDNFAQPLSAKMLFDWHKLLVNSFSSNVRVGGWRIDSEPMQIISGKIGNPEVFFEAPPANIVPQEMQKFIEWFNSSKRDFGSANQFPAIRAAITHLYFESIHPFDDGNGRIGRALAEKALSQGFGYPVILSLSTAIESDKKAYYDALHLASVSNEITPWLIYFLNIILQAQDITEKQINFVLQKNIFLEKYKPMLNERELKVIHRMLNEGIKGFKGGMSAKKYVSIANTSKATATRDLHHLVAINAFIKTGSGRNVKYQLNFN